MISNVASRSFAQAADTPVVGAAAPTGTTSTGTATDASNTAIQTGPGGKMGKDEFLKLLVAQMKNQDPLNPMNGQEMAAQLAQFSSVEQLININNTLGEQSKAQDALSQAIAGGMAINAVGRTATVETDQIKLGAGGETVTSEIPAGGGTAILHIYDSTGQEVGSRALGTLAGGRQTFDVGAAGTGLPAGTYSCAVEVTDSAGASSAAPTFVTGRVDAFKMTKNGPVLSVGGIDVPFSAITQLT
jgi:flagellar basal-body rod modification protein FlgD